MKIHPHKAEAIGYRTSHTPNLLVWDHISIFNFIFNSVFYSTLLQIRPEIHERKREVVRLQEGDGQPCPHLLETRHTTDRDQLQLCANKWVTELGLTSLCYSTCTVMNVKRIKIFTYKKFYVWIHHISIKSDLWRECATLKDSKIPATVINFQCNQWPFEQGFHAWSPNCNNFCKLYFIITSAPCSCTLKTEVPVTFQ
jgi:hypothetical protein